MEKETDLKQSGPLVLFNVDRKGRLADYAVCHSDYECGDYLLRQAELALGGAYVPNESVYCLAGAERTDDGLPELLDDYIREGNIRDLPSIGLRSLTFIHETTGGGLPEGMWAILKRRNSCWTARITEKYWKRTMPTTKKGECPARAHPLRRPHGQGSAPVRRLGPGAAMPGGLPAVPRGPVFFPRAPRAGKTGGIPFQHIR